MISPIFIITLVFSTLSQGMCKHIPLYEFENKHQQSYTQKNIESKQQIDARVALENYATKSTNAVLQRDVQALVGLSTAQHQDTQSVANNLLQEYAFLAQLQGAPAVVETYKKDHAALQQFVNAYIPTTKSYSVSAEVGAVLQKDATKYEVFHGTAPQHALHKETVNLLNDSAQFVAQHAEEIAQRVGSVAAICADKAYEFNCKQDIQQGYGWIDIGKLLLRCGESAVKGAWYGGVEVVNQTIALITHPLQTAQSIVKTVTIAGNALAHPQETAQQIYSLLQKSITFVADGSALQAIKDSINNAYQNPESSVETATKMLVQLLGYKKFVKPLQAFIQNNISLAKVAHAVTNKVIPNKKIPSSGKTIGERKCISSSEKYNYQHGRYQDAPYHLNNSIGSKKSPAPRDGQRALDNSLAVSEKTFRISIEDDKFVMLKETQKGEYHGYLIENSLQNWERLDPAARTALKQAGLTTSRGKILNENNK